MSQSYSVGSSIAAATCPFAVSSAATCLINWHLISFLHNVLNVR